MQAESRHPPSLHTTKRQSAPRSKKFKKNCTKIMKATRNLHHFVSKVTMTFHGYEKSTARITTSPGTPRSRP